MSHPAEPADSVERFAELSGLLADPFADRDGILREAGLNERRWSELETAWAAVLRDDPGLAERFAAVHEATLRALAAPALPSIRVPPTSAGPRFLSIEAQPWRAQAASVGLDAGAPPPVAAGASAPPLTPPVGAGASAPPPAPPEFGATVGVDLRAMLPAVPFRAPGPVNPLGDTLPVPERLPVPPLPFSPKP